MSPFTIVMIVLAILLIGVILLQQKSSSLGAMAGDTGDEIAQTRRGADQLLHRLTIVLAVIFVAGALYGMFS